MGQFRSYGGFDDPITSDGDVGFVGMNLRLLPNQLQPGEVRLSRNGRMDGYWQGRKGIALRSGALSQSVAPLMLPFWLVDTSGGDAISAASLTSNVVSMTVTGHGLPFGSLNATATLSPAGANNDVLYTAVNAGSVGNSVSVEYAALADATDAVVTLSGNDITVTPGSKSLMVVSGATGGQAVLNGTYEYSGGSWVNGGCVLYGGPSWVITNFSESIVILATETWPDEETWPGGVTVTAAASTAASVISAVNADPIASALVVASNAPGNDGSGSVTAVAKTSLTGGRDGSQSAYLTVQGLVFTTTDPNGVRLVTPTDANTLTFPLTGANETYTIGGGNDKVLSLIDDDAVGAIYGSCHFSDPNSNLQESIILATTLEAKKVTIGDYVVTSLPYPSGESIDGPVEMLQAFDRVYLFRDGQVAFEWVPAGKPVISGSYVSLSGIVELEIKSHGLKVGDSITVSDVGFSATAPTGDPNGTHVVSSVVDVDTIQYVIATGNGDETYTPATGKVVAEGFTLVPQGDYTQPQTFSISGDDVIVTSGLAEFTVVANNTIEVGDFITIYGTDDPHFEHLIDRSFEVIEATPTSIKCYIPVEDHAGSGHAGETVVIGGRFSVNGGFTHMPAPPWATYFQRRLWCPLWYDTTGTYSTSYSDYTVVDRGQRDQICASDILDGDTYDRVYSQFRITGGTADYTVAMQPFYEDKLMVLNRNSLHLVNGTQGTLTDTIVTELTREVGCLARKSVVQYSSAVFFLSDSGVYGVEFIDQYNLRGINEPLSKNIQPLIDRINKSLASNAVGIYFNNRYWLAVPLDSAVGANDAQGNNSVLIYNLLNKGWESIDNYSDDNFNIINFHVAQDEERNSLFLVNEFGGLHEVDARETPVDIYSTNVLGASKTASVKYELVSRGYDFKTSDRKKFSRMQVQLEADKEAADVVFAFSSEDPDSGSYSIGSVNGALGEDLQPNEAATVRLRLGNPRGIYGTLTIGANMAGSAPIGRPKINNIVVDATPTNRQTLSQS